MRFATRRGPSTRLERMVRARDDRTASITVVHAMSAATRSPSPIIDGVVKSSTTCSRASVTTPARCLREQFEPRNAAAQTPIGESRANTRAEQRGRDRVPLGLERAGRDRLAGGAVPVAGIGQIALDAVQIGVHPGGVRAFVVHDDLVRLVPVALGGPPQGFERGQESRRRVRRRTARREIRKSSPLPHSARG